MPTAPCWWCANKAALEGLTHRPLFTELRRRLEFSEVQMQDPAQPQPWRHRVFEGRAGTPRPQGPCQGHSPRPLRCRPRAGGSEWRRPPLARRPRVRRPQAPLGGRVCVGRDRKTSKPGLSSGPLLQLLPKLLPRLAVLQTRVGLGSEKASPYLRRLAAVALGHRAHREGGLRRAIPGTTQLLHQPRGDDKVLVVAEIVLDLLEELHHLLCRLGVDLLQGLHGVAQALPFLSQVVEVLWGRVLAQRIGGLADLLVTVPDELRRCLQDGIGGSRATAATQCCRKACDKALVAV